MEYFREKGQALDYWSVWHNLFMVLKHRLNSPGAFYHVILRVNNGLMIFFDNSDRCRFYFLMQESISKFRNRSTLSGSLEKIIVRTNSDFKEALIYPQRSEKAYGWAFFRGS